jgi:hypothetical protein
MRMSAKGHDGTGRSAGGAASPGTCIAKLGGALVRQAVVGRAG